jgi:hypothetical protein
MYELQTSVNPFTATSWTSGGMSPKSTFTIADLTSGTQAWVRVRALGTDPLPGEWSDPALITVP